MNPLNSVMQLRAEFADSGGSLANPSNVVFSVRRPRGAWREYVYGSSAVQRPSTGVYTLDITGDVIGTWEVKVTGSEPGQVQTTEFVIGS
jgi:hypothetical protein